MGKSDVLSRFKSALYSGVIIHWYFRSTKLWSSFFCQFQENYNQFNAHPIEGTKVEVIKNETLKSKRAEIVEKV